MALATSHASTSDRAASTAVLTPVADSAACMCCDIINHIFMLRLKPLRHNNMSNLNNAQGLQMHLGNQRAACEGTLMSEFSTSKCNTRSSSIAYDGRVAATSMHMQCSAV